MLAIIQSQPSVQVNAGSSLSQGDNRNSMASVECALDEDKKLIVEVQSINAYDFGECWVPRKILYRGISLYLGCVPRY